MNAALLRYESASLYLRLAFLVGSAVLANAIYCLIYRYTSGDPATLWEATSWGLINLAPWVAAIEIGRHAQRRHTLGWIVLFAALASLTLGAIDRAAMPDWFDLVRRAPAALATIVALAGLEIYRKRQSHRERAARHQCDGMRCDWARAAGNYVELHSTGAKPYLMRSTLSAYVDGAEQDLVRIHRSFAVSPAAMDAVERNHVRLRDGTRLPIGNAFRSRLNPA